LSDLSGLGFWTKRTDSQTNYIFEWLTANRQLIRRKSFPCLIRLDGPKCTPGVSAGRMAWEATAGTGGVGGLLRWASAVCCWCGGKRLSCRGENHSKREVPLDQKVVRKKFTL